MSLSHCESFNRLDQLVTSTFVLSLLVISDMCVLGEVVRALPCLDPSFTFKHCFSFITVKSK